MKCLERLDNLKDSIDFEDSLNELEKIEKTLE